MIQQKLDSSTKLNQELLTNINSYIMIILEMITISFQGRMPDASSLYVLTVGADCSRADCSRAEEHALSVLTANFT